MTRKSLVLCAASLCAWVGSATTLHWRGADGSGVGDFETATNWVENAAPVLADFIVVKNYFTANWTVNFNGDATNWKAELAASSANYETRFNLNGYTWAFTNDLHMADGGGGRITFTNGTIRAPGFRFITQPAGATTNLVLSVKSVDCEVGTNDYAATRATFEGGSLRVTNALLVGAVGYGVGTLVLDKGVQCSVTNVLLAGDASGATGEIVNISGRLEQTATNGLFLIGNSGRGSLSLQGGSTLIRVQPCFGNNNTGVGTLTVSGGSNTFGTVSGALLIAGEAGKGFIAAYGGTNYANGLSLGHGNSGYGEMVLTNGVWNLSSYSWIAYFGRAVVTITGGRLNSGPSFCIGRGSGTGEVTVAGGTLDVNGEVRLGGNPTSLGRLTLTGNGVLRAGYISEYTAGANSELLFDGGTLQARTGAGALIRSVDDIRLTTNGLALDTAGYNVTITGVLQNAAGQAGRLVKKGAGTLTLASDHAATGPVEVLGGTLKPDAGKAITLSGGASVAGGAVLDVSLASGTEYTTASGSVSKIDGALTLKGDGRLIVGSGAALAGTGTVARVTFQDNAVFVRNKADNATRPLSIGEGVANGRLTVALNGYSLQELKTDLPLLQAPTAFVAPERVTVTLDGEASPVMKVRHDEVGGQQVLSAFYSIGMLILLQ